MKYLYFLSTLLLAVATTAQKCTDSSDFLISGRCFKLVNKQLSYQDARDWCRYSNPVGFTYLATVADPNTDNFLASYARTTFNSNEGSFWIGLTRASTSSKWQWEDGTPVVWTNFQVQNSQKYAAESITNGKWTGYSPDTKMNFVCSYWPGATPGPTPGVETTAPYNWQTTVSESYPTPTGPCLPTSKSTFLFAYSNDVEASIVENAAKKIGNIGGQYIGSGNIRFRTLASVRFDVANDKEQIFYNSNGTEFYNTVLKNLPDEMLDFPNSTTDSNILDVIEKFLFNTVSPICGSVIFILLKRYPDEIDASKLLFRLRDQHVSLQTFISSDAYGGSDKQVLYDLSVKTNGFCGFAESLTNADVTTLFMTNYLFYAVNPTVSGVGTVELPPAMLNEPDLFGQGVWVFMEINVQSHALDDSFQSLEILMYDERTNRTEVITFEKNTWKLKKPFHTFDLADKPVIQQGRAQRMTFNYNYSDSKEQHLQIRMFTAYDNLPWYPYTD